MYKIAIDIDDTICNTNELIVIEADKYDKEVLGGTGIKNKEAYAFTEMMGWGPEGKGIFFSDRLEYIMENTELKKNAKEVINKLYDEGNEIIFLTFRKPKYLKDPYKLTYDWLEKNGIKYNKLFVNTGSKADECLSLNVDLFIDDMPHNCEDVSNVGVPVVLFDNMYNQDENRFVRMNNWDDIYEYIKKGDFKWKSE